MLQQHTVITLEHDSYTLQEQIAQSSYGVVWRASAMEQQREVAIKLINSERMTRALPAARAHWIDSAKNEISFLRSLGPWDQRHIVRLEDSGLHDGLPVLALELMGRDLGRHVASTRNVGMPIALSQTLDWLEQINQALDKVHQYGWRYLDLKPGNVLLDRRQLTVKLADFGTNRSNGQLAPHGYVGTANWQAPEQFFPADAHGYQTSARTDYFALGAMFYYLVTGGLTLRFCRDCGQAYNEHQNDAPAWLRARNGGTIAPTLREDEATLFAHRIDHALDSGESATWRPDGAIAPGTTAATALALLRSLLSAQPALRPRHALEISRMLAQVRRTVHASAAVAVPVAASQIVLRRAELNAHSVA